GGKIGPGLLGEDKYPDAEEWMPKEMLAFEKEALGFYISGHPLDLSAGEMRRFTTASCANCMEKGERNEVILAGVINAFTERPLKSGLGKIAYFNLEDHTGQIEFFVSSKKLEEYREILSHDDPMLM